MFMTFEIYHNTGTGSHRLRLDDNSVLPLAATISDYGGLEGIHTTLGRFLVLADVIDHGQYVYPLKVMYPGSSEYVVYDFRRGQTRVLGLGIEQEDTLFGHAIIHADVVGLHRV